MPFAFQSACPVCSSLKIEILYDLTNTDLQGGIPGSILNCRECGMLFKQFDEDLDSVYSGRHVDAAFQEEYMGGKRACSFFRSVLRRSRLWSRGLRGRPGLLDIGTGLGTMLEVAGELGFEAEGVELCAELAESARAKGLKVHNGRAEDLCTEKKFEIITMMDIIEHLPNPLSVLISINSLIAPGGELIVYTPNHKSPIVRMASLLHTMGIKAPLRNIFETNHVSFFDYTTLPEILKRAGFSVKEMIVKPYDPFRPGGPISLISLLAVSSIEYLGCLLGMPGFRLLAYAVPASWRADA